MSVRLACVDDLPSILEISNRAALNTVANFAVEPETLESWRRSYDETSERYPWFVAVDDAGLVLGFAKASPWKGRCAYAFAVEVTVYVREAHHGRGIGTALYKELFETLAAQGYRTALGGIALPNAASVRLHESFGMRRAAVFERIGWKFGQWHDVGYWQAELQDGEGEPGEVRAVAEVMGEGG